MPAGAVTKIIGAKHEVGRVRAASIFESPEELARKLSVLTLASAGLPMPSMVRQLTVARKLGSGFTSRRFSGTDGSSARTSPVTWIPEVAASIEQARASATRQGSP